MSTQEIQHLLPIGQQPILDGLPPVFQLWRDKAEHLGLGIPPMEALTQLASTEMETSPIQTTSDLMRTLTSIFDVSMAHGVAAVDAGYILVSIMNDYDTEYVYGLNREGGLLKGFKADVR